MIRYWFPHVFSVFAEKRQFQMNHTDVICRWMKKRITAFQDILSGLHDLLQPRCWHVFISRDYLGSMSTENAWFNLCAEISLVLILVSYSSLPEDRV